MELETIYIEYKDKVTAYLSGKVGNITVAEELCSDVFVKVAAALDRFDSQKASVSTWIYRIAHNTLCDYYRTRHEHASLEDYFDVDDKVLEETVCRDDSLDALADALEALPPRERELIVRRYYYGETLKMIAARFSVSYAYVRILHTNALKKMKKFLE